MELVRGGRTASQFINNLNNDNNLMKSRSFLLFMMLYERLLAMTFGPWCIILAVGCRDNFMYIYLYIFIGGPEAVSKWNTNRSWLGSFISSAKVLHYLTVWLQFRWRRSHDVQPDRKPQRKRLQYTLTLYETQTTSCRQPGNRTFSASLYLPYHDVS